MKISDMLVAKGLGADDARLVEDLGIHAVEEACKTLVRISETAPEHLRGVAMITACMMMSMHLKRSGKEILLGVLNDLAERV
jgi:hypothetical protein